MSPRAKKLRFANAGQNGDGWLDLGAMTVGPGGSAGPASHEAEAPGNTLTGGAVVTGCGGCSGGAKVGYVGKGATLTFRHVDGGSGGTRTVTVHYATRESRTATVRVGGGTPRTSPSPRPPTGTPPRPSRCDWICARVRTTPSPSPAPTAGRPTSTGSP